MQNTHSPKSKKKPKPTVPLLELLACNATKGAREILKKHGASDATGYEDLQSKLADLYKKVEDKVELEKEFAEIHPHKEFILKYLSPPPAKTTITIPEPVSAATGEAPVITPITNNTDFLIAAISIVGIVGLVIHATK